MLFRKNPKKSSEILQSVAKLADFFYFLSDFQEIKMRNVSRETLRWNKKLFWCEMDEKNEPQATAVELAQLGGGGWFPTMWGNVPKGQKGRASSKMEDKLSSLTEVAMNDIEI